MSLKGNHILYLTILILLLTPIKVVSQCSDWDKLIANQNLSMKDAITDKNGNLFIVGVLLKTTQVGSVVLTSDDLNGFIVKFDKNGLALWGKSILGRSSIDNIGVDSFGNIVVAGFFYSNVINWDLIRLQNSGRSDIYVAKLTSEGKTIWAKSFKGTGDDEGSKSIQVAPNGDIFCTGHYTSPTLQFDSFSISNTGGYDSYIVSLDTNGVVKWVKNIGRTNGNYPVYTRDLAIDSKGSVIVGGLFQSPGLKVDDVVLLAFPSTYINYFLMKFDSSGKIIWGKGPDVAINYGIEGLAVDGSDNIYTTGSFGEGTLTFDAISLKTNGVDDAFLVKYNSGGTVQWAQSFGGAGRDAGSRVAIDKLGHLYLAGFFHSNSIKVGQDVFLKTESTPDIFISKIDQQGNNICSWRTHGDAYDIPFCLRLDENQNLYLGVDNFFLGGSTYFGDKLSSPDPLASKILAKLGITAGTSEDTDTGEDTDKDGDTDTDTDTDKHEETNTNEDTDSDLCDGLIDRITFPNVITPNNDNINEFYVVDKAILGSEFEVFNRWGKSVFHINNYQNNWNAENLPEGIYYYLIKVSSCNALVIKGFVSILR